MNQKEICERAGWSSTSGYVKLSYIINRVRECSPEDAITLEDVTGIHRKVWLCGSKKQVQKELKAMRQRMRLERAGVREAA